LPSAPAAAMTGMNQAQADQVGWQRYTDQVARAAAGSAAIITSNYGQAGALDRFGPPDLPPVHSGHNALWELGGPAEGADPVLVVGGQAPAVRGLFAGCETVGHLDNGVAVENEEQGMPLVVCEGPVGPWEELWPRF